MSVVAPISWTGLGRYYDTKRGSPRTPSRKPALMMGAWPVRFVPLHIFYRSLIAVVWSQGSIQPSGISIPKPGASEGTM